MSAHADKPMYFLHGVSVGCFLHFQFVSAPSMSLRIILLPLMLLMPLNQHIVLIHETCKSLK